MIRAGVGAGLMGGSSGLYSALVEPQWLAVEQVEVRLKRLPPGLDGLTIAQLSDLHRGPYIDDDQIQSAVQIVNQLNPDMVVLTGDYVSRSARYADPCAQVLSSLHARLGVFAILGNHDHWTDADSVADALQSQGIQVLRNAAVPIEHNQARLWLAGVDDVWTKNADLDVALRQVPRDEATILLAHEPDYADEAARYPVDLQLSGHSHGGQVRIPFVGALILPHLGVKYPIGLNQVGSLQIYTNRGIGLIGPPVRLNCRPEVTMLRLRSVTT